MSLIQENEIIPLIEKAIHNRTETTNIEFKDSRGGMPGDIWRTISSFSHSPKGGVIVFGIKEDRATGKIEVVNGLDLALLQEKIISYMREEIANHAEYALYIVEYNEKALLALVIQETKDERKPCYKKTIRITEWSMYSHW